MGLAIANAVSSTSFNGARPRRAWKQSARIKARERFTRFNGARPRRAWKRPYGTRTEALAAASMEPDPGGPGNPRDKLGVPADKRASMEPDPGGPGNMTIPQPPRRRRQPLQWSQTPEGLETLVAAGLFHHRPGASMEPDPGGPGNPLRTSPGCGQPLASMEPDPGGPGNVATKDAAKAVAYVLQWSQTPEGLETLRVSQRLDDWQWLQWSQTPEGLETWPVGCLLRWSVTLQWSQTPEGLETFLVAQEYGFTLSASMEPDPGGPGNGGPSTCSALATATLQWSQTPEGLETHLSATLGVERTVASMEPDPGGPGNSRRASAAAALPGRFNGARPRRAWKPDAGDSPTKELGVLQWSQTPEGLETRSTIA